MAPVGASCVCVPLNLTLDLHLFSPETDISQFIQTLNLNFSTSTIGLFSTRINAHYITFMHLFIYCLMRPKLLHDNLNIGL